MGVHRGVLALYLCHVVAHVADIGSQVLLEDLERCELVHAVHVGQASEVSLVGGEQPVDGAVLVHLLVVLPKVFVQVVFQAPA